MAVTVIINPVSGGARPPVAQQRARVAAAALEAVGEQGVVMITEGPGHAREIAGQAARRCDRLVIAWGGDGTVNEAASAVAFSATSLAIVPAGSGNGLATELGVSRDPRRAIGEALAADPRSIDVGEMGACLFVNLAGVGFDAHIAACFDRESSRRGLWGYVRLTLRELATYRSGRYRIDEEAAFRRAFLITVANAPQFGHGARIAPGARVDDGQLDLVVYEEGSRLATLCAVPRLFSGRISGVRGVSIRKIAHASIESDAPMRFHVDGEPRLGPLTLPVRVHPRALRVAVR